MWRVRLILIGCCFASKPDYTIELTDKEKEQALQAGVALKNLVGNDSLYFFVSPFWRTRTAFEQVAKAIPRKQFEYREDPRIREQEFGYICSDEKFEAMCRERKQYGSFYYI